MPAGLSRAVSRARSTRVGRLVTRLLRYGATSAICLGISEVTLIILVGTGLTGATAAALIANIAGVPPSYLLSRYWIWHEADRRNTGRQVVLYWLVSAISIAITSFATGFVAHHSSTRGAAHVELVGGAFLGLNFVLWLAKYVAYQTVVFRSAKSSPAASDQLTMLASPDVLTPPASAPKVLQSSAVEVVPAEQLGAAHSLRPARSAQGSAAKNPVG